MELTEDESIQKNAKHCGHCKRKLSYHTNMNLLAYHVDST